ncbi:MAG: pilus assembly protein FimV [Cocleimonas sp.]|jgi:pilus assembly protein FimV
MIKIKRGIIVNKKALSLAICLAMAIPTASNALSLGGIESKSSLNQPFQGRINLLQTSPSEVQNLRIRVASPEVFNRVGIDRPAFLNSIRFRTAVQNGKPVILVSSNQPINEPFLNFLLEVSWPNGQLLKEYTVLLDPPVLLRPNTAIASNNAGIRAEPRAQGQIKRAPQMTPQQLQAQRQRQAQAQQGQAQAQQGQAQAQQGQAQAQQGQGVSEFERQAQQVLQGQPARRVAAAPARSTSRASSGTYRVRKGDTLSKIASRLGVNGVGRDQMMMALFEKNRRAFSQGNMNNLKAGVVMARPSAQEAKSLSSRQAKSQIIAQARAWKAKRTQIASTGTNNGNKTNNARLEVLGKTSGATANNSSSGGNSAAAADLNQKLALLNESLTTKQQENIELKSRVGELESLLRKKNRLIALKSEQLAGLQSGMSANDPQAADQNSETQGSNLNNDAVVANIGNDIQDQVAGELASENGEIVRANPETAIVDNNQQLEQIISEPEPEIVEPEVAKQEPASNAFKPEPEAGMDIMGLVTSPVGLAAGLGSLALLGGFAFMRRRKNKSDDVEDFSGLIDSGLNDQPFEDDIIETSFDDQQANEDSEFVEQANDNDLTTQESAIPDAGDDSELDDVIQEADVYIVYGLHDQAESEIKRALMTYPDNAALHAKLLENFKAAGDAEAFEDATKTFMKLESDEKQNYWDEICEWGNALLPDSKLYDSSSLADVAGVAAAGAAMVAGTAIAAAKDDAGDLFSDMSDKATETLKSAVSEDDLIEDTILDEFDEVDLATDIHDFDDFDDLDLDGVLDADELDDITGSVEIADLDDDFVIDLDDDFDSLGSIDSNAPSNEEVKTEVTLNDNHDVEENIEDTDFLFDDESLEDLLNAETDDDLSVMNLMDDDASGDNDVNSAANLNLEIGAEDFDKIMPENNAYKSKSNDLNVQFDADGDDNLLADFDDNLSFLDLDDHAEVIGETQIETKIDLARAYIDMGDIEGARSTLEEVMESGSDEQKRQAEELLHQNG